MELKTPQDFLNYVRKQQSNPEGQLNDSEIHMAMIMFKNHVLGEQPHWVEHILNEVKRAEEKHPNWPKDKIYAMAIVGEEYGEAQREAVKIEMDESDKSIPNLKKEVIQTAATCIRLLKNL